ncbi:MAG: Alpha-galactosidase [Bacilli bacterium]|nr:Alpha-galactosidase [Bacilli bacterium]
MTEIGSDSLPADRQRETAHRYILGVYKVMEKITSVFPNVLFESCSGGGGRFDPGILHYMPQTWTSDNTDAISRLKIQYGTSIVYPSIAMGAHVSAVPNHQVHRSASLQTRAHVAMAGNFGYELDLTALANEEKHAITQQVSFYKQHRQLIQFGEHYRLLNPFEGNASAWMFVSDEQKEVLVTYCRILSEPNPPTQRLRLKGLDPNFNYRLIGTDQTFGGDELMYAGIVLPNLIGDFATETWNFRVE